MIEIRQTEGYFQWFKSLNDRQARGRIDARIRRLSLGNLGDVKPVGEGVSELRIDYGPGYRVYFVKRGKRSWYSSRVATRKPKTGISKKRWNLRANYRGLLWRRLKPVLGMWQNI
jgi:putative addiction module killer protein